MIIHYNKLLFQLEVDPEHAVELDRDADETVEFEQEEYETEVDDSTEASLRTALEHLEIEVSLSLNSVEYEVFFQNQIVICIDVLQAANSRTLGISLRTLALEWATERSEYVSLLADYKARTERQARKVSRGAGLGVELKPFLI